MSKVIKISEEIYEQLSILADETDMPISKVATTLIKEQLGKVSIKEKTCVKKYIVFEE